MAHCVSENMNHKNTAYAFAESEEPLQENIAAVFSS